MKYFITVLIALTVITSSGAVFAQTATVAQVTGKVEVQKGSDWVTLKTGDTVTKGNVISTGFKSELLLKINNSTVKLGPLTRMTFEELLSSDVKNQTAIFIDSGKISAQVNATGVKREDFKVSSPVATASVRGTSFEYKANGTLITTSGLVSKGPPRSAKAEVSESAEPSEFVPEEGESTAFTDVSEVSAEPAGIPVFAGQTSTTDTSTGQAVPPQVAAAKAATKVDSGTERLAVQEAAAPAAAVTQVTEIITDTPVSSGLGRLAVEVVFED